MKATGIIRRVDDLGRIVIPRELRIKFGISDGTPMEFSTNGEYLCLSRYCPEDISQESQFAKKLYEWRKLLYDPFGVDLYDLEHTLVYGCIQGNPNRREIPISIDGDHIGYLNVPIEAPNEDGKVNKIAFILYNPYNL